MHTREENSDNRKKVLNFKNQTITEETMQLIAEEIANLSENAILTINLKGVILSYENYLEIAALLAQDKKYLKIILDYPNHVNSTQLEKLTQTYREIVLSHTKILKLNFYTENIHKSNESLTQTDRNLGIIFLCCERNNLLKKYPEYARYIKQKLSPLGFYLSSDKEDPISVTSLRQMMALQLFAEKNRMAENVPAEVMELIQRASEFSKKLERTIKNVNELSALQLG